MTIQKIIEFVDDLKKSIPGLTVDIRIRGGEKKWSKVGIKIHTPNQRNDKTKKLEETENYKILQKLSEGRGYTTKYLHGGYCHVATYISYGKDEINDSEK